MAFFLKIIGTCSPGGAHDWVGWEAALIQYKERGAKEKNPPTDLDGLFDEDSGQKKVKSDGHFTAEFMGNDSARLSTESASIPYAPSGESMADHALQYGHWSVVVKLDVSRSVHVAKVVGGLADTVKHDISWKPIEKLLSKEMCSKLKESVSSGIAKFILSIFDVEDFTKDIVSDDRKANFMKLARKLMVPDKADTFGEQQKQKFKNGNEARKYIAEEINLDFKGLNEIDVSFLIGYCNLKHYDEKVVEDGLKQLCPRRNMGEFQVALKQMGGYVPLKEKYKMQLFLEMVRHRHCHIIDYLFVEVCQGFVTHDLAEALDKDGFPRLTELVCEVRQAIVRLVELKMGELNRSRLRAGYPLHGGMFGKFDDEVIEVIRIADYERRIQGHPFIGVYHILFSLRFSRVGLHPLVGHGFNKSSAEKLPEAPPYKIYKLAGEYAEYCGGDKIVELEHLALAVTDVQQGRTTVDPQQDWKVVLDELARSDYEFPGYGFTEFGLRDASNNPIEGLGKLVKAIKEGLKIPEIRESGHWTK